MSDAGMMVSLPPDWLFHAPVIDLAAAEAAGKRLAEAYERSFLSAWLVLTADRAKAGKRDLGDAP